MSTETKYLKRFFAVTANSLYEASWEEIDEFPRPILTKLALRKGKHTNVPIGERIMGGQLLAVWDMGLTMYHEDYSPYGVSPWPHQWIGSVNMNNWSWRTTPVVGLFLRREGARECLGVEKFTCPDPRWRASTQRVLNHLQGYHPAFMAVSEWSQLIG